jgi:hypothetical protein
LFQGSTVVDLTPAQTQAWRDKLQPIYTQWLKETLGGNAVLTKYRAPLKEASASR